MIQKSDIEAAVQEVMRDLARVGVTLPLPIQQRLRNTWMSSLTNNLGQPVSQAVAAPPPPPTTFLSKQFMAQMKSHFARAAQRATPKPQFVFVINDDPEPPPPLPSTTKFGEISAFRVWRIRVDGILQSTYMNTYWPPGQIIEADGEIRDYFEHTAPGNGIHAWKSVFEVLEYSKNLLRPRYEIRDDIFRPPAWAVMIGKVKLWGDVIEHERGYRAKYAKIESLDEIVTARRLGEMEGISLQVDPFARHVREAAGDELTPESRMREDYLRALREWKWTEDTLPDFHEMYFPEKRT